MLLALGLITAGLLSSTFHLGHPERAWRAFSQWRTSWLSREGVAAVATYVPACLFGLAWVFGGNGVLIAILGYLTAIMAMVTVFTTAMIYASLPTIRQWRHWAVVPGYIVLAIATGAVLLYALATLFGRSGIPALGVITMAGLALAIIVKLAYWAGLSRMKPKYTMGDATGLGGTVRQWEVPHTSENFVQREMGFKVARKHALKLRGICIGLLALALVMVWAGFSFGGAAAPVLAVAVRRAGRHCRRHGTLAVLRRGEARGHAVLRRTGGVICCHHRRWADVARCITTWAGSLRCRRRARTA